MGWVARWQPPDGLGAINWKDSLGQGGMGEVWRARHRSGPTRCHQAHQARCDRKYRPEDRDRHRPAFRARGAGDRQPALAPHRRAIRFRHCRRSLLLRDGTARRTRRRCTGAALRSHSARAIHLLSQVCHSLSEAHSRGLVHRDMSRQLVRVSLRRGTGTLVKVLDVRKFAKESARESGDAGLTNADAIQGTPAFLAPEQALGATDLDGRCDIGTENPPGILAPDRAAGVHRRHTRRASRAPRPDHSQPAVGANGTGCPRGAR